MTGINKIIHERARLLILTYLASNEHDEVSFNELQAKLELLKFKKSLFKATAIKEFV